MPAAVPLLAAVEQAQALGFASDPSPGFFFVCAPWSLVRCGKNYGWGRFEGDLCVAGNEFDNAELGSCDDADFSSYEPPIFQYCHDSYQYDGDASPYTKGVDVCGDRSVVGQAVIGETVQNSRNSECVDWLLD